MSYHITPHSNLYKKNRFNALDHVEGEIKIEKFGWKCNLELFCIGDWSLPPNTLTGSFSVENETLENIIFYIKTDQTKKGNVRHSSEYAKIYEANFSLPYQKESYFQKDISSDFILCQLKLKVDPRDTIEVIKSSSGKVNITQENLDCFIAETNNLSWEFRSHYCNTLLMNDKMLDCIFYTTGYKYDEISCLPGLGEFIEQKNYSVMEFHDYSQQVTPIIDMCRIYTDQITRVSILSIKYDFYYSVDSQSDLLHFTYTDPIQKNCKSRFMIYFMMKTIYDTKKKMIVKNWKGTTGFFLPTGSKGFYTIEMIVNNDNTIVKYLLKNNFCFATNKKVTVKKITIKDIANYKLERITI